MSAWKTAVLGLAVLALPIAAASQNALDLSASSSQSPVTINSCQPMLNNPAPTASPNVLSQLLTPATSSGMRIGFTNESDKVADLINFEVHSNGATFVIRDVGTFSPGITIDHRFRNGAGQAFVLPAFIAPHVTCRVASVRFADRSVWPVEPAAAPAPAAAATLSANPASLDIARSVDSALLMVSSTGRVAGFNEKDDCQGIASIFVSTTAQTSAVYSVKPIAAGTCTARVTDEAGRTISVPITVH
jgi:hypothetical protein